MVKMSSIQVVLGLAASLDLEIEQLNVKTTFLNGDLEKEMYMKKRKDLKLQAKKIWCVDRKKSLYGLK